MEGQTEERFVEQILQPHLNPSSEFDGFWLQPIVVMTSRTPLGAKNRGGGGWSHYDRDLRRLLVQKHWYRIGLLLDYYAYPADAPGVRTAGAGRTRHQQLLEALAQKYPDPRFVPGVALHEFETWVIAALLAVRPSLGGPEVHERLQVVAGEHAGDLELIDDGPATAPSKRLKDAWPGYLKTVDGIDALRESGLEKISDDCPVLGNWIRRLAEG
ncbi:DUF4276 family protein [Kineosporia babensis]|uniref:DUF4276 family protein n=1 Tax=Kineosporia babensis TaxID=499548 RepID=A0A9X1SW25_9ACTN|nr:DUF4276 family protein [Kineosporia babensis]